jgi:hypothetical protein
MDKICFSALEQRSFLTTTISPLRSLQTLQAIKEWVAELEEGL